MIARALITEPRSESPARPGRVIATGQPASAGRATGPARTVRTVSDLDHVQRGDILIVPDASPEWIVASPTAGALITETGGALGSLATLAREHGIPLVVGASGAFNRIPDGTHIEVDGSSGEVRLAPAFA